MHRRHSSERSSVGVPHRGHEAPARGTMDAQHMPHRPRSPPVSGWSQCGQRPGSSASVAAVRTPPVCTVGIVPEVPRHGAGGDRRCGDRPRVPDVELTSYTALMQVQHHEMTVASEGHGHTYDLTESVARWLESIMATAGQLTVFVPGSTAAVTTIEYEPGALRDLDEALEKIAPAGRSYHHDLRWGDGNGFSHLRAALMGPSLTVPVADGRCILGTWQQIVLVECDLHARRRRVVLSYVGHCEGSE